MGTTSYLTLALALLTQMNDVISFPDADQKIKFRASYDKNDNQMI